MSRRLVTPRTCVGCGGPRYGGGQRKYCSHACSVAHRRPLGENVIARIDTSVDGCWPWPGGQDGRGYGVLRERAGGRWFKAHRFMWERANGRPIPPGLEIRHTCDNPICVNPAHLVPGTHAENMADYAARGPSPHSRRTCRRVAS